MEHICKKNVISITGKCSDLCSITLPGGRKIEGYVPSDLGIGEGDYIEFRYCAVCGRILDDAFPLKL